MNKPIRRPTDNPTPAVKIASRIALGILVVAVVYWARPIFYPLAIRFYVEPLVWLLPLLIFLTGVAVAVRRRRKAPNYDIVGGPPSSLKDRLADAKDPSDVVRALGSSPGPLLISAALAFGVFVFMGIFSAPLVSLEIYANTTYKPIKTFPASGAVRLTPKEVAERVAGSGFNSPTERLTDFHLIRRDGELAWTALRTPDGVYRAFTQKSPGTLELNASTSSRQTKQADGVFETAPGMLITDNLTWRLRKERFFAELDDAIALTDSNGKPLIAVSYITYKGWLVRRPVFGGVFIVHPDGRIEDLSPTEAIKRKELVAAGRIYPEKLARREQDAFAYKGGLFNKWFTHEEQTQISSTENNPQPYLLDFGKLGLKYVSAAEPYGRAFAVNSIFLTDAINGQTTIWRPPNNSDLTGNRRVLETVRSLSIPGVVFADTATNAPGDRGGFRVVEPRPIVVNERLVFMTSIVPDNANNVSKTVFIDAQSNRVAAIFDNDSDDQIDRKIADFIAGGAAKGDLDLIDSGTGDANRGATAPTGDSTGGATGPAAADDRDARERVDDLLKRQREMIEELELLRDELNRG